MPNKSAQGNSRLVYLAPMAGISDLPFRELVSSLGMRLARKHLNWYMKNSDFSTNFKQEILTTSFIHHIRSMIPTLINSKYIDSDD